MRHLAACRCTHSYPDAAALQVRNIQLDKEAGELRLQNEELQHELQSARQGVRRSEEVRAPITA